MKSLTTTVLLQILWRMFKLCYPEKVSESNVKLVAYLLDISSESVEDIFSSWFSHASGPQSSTEWHPTDPHVVNPVTACSSFEESNLEFSRCPSNGDHVSNYIPHPFRSNESESNSDSSQGDLVIDEDYTYTPVIIKLLC